MNNLNFNSFTGDTNAPVDRSDSISPDVIVSKVNTTKVIIPEQFKTDINSLEDYIGEKLVTGLSIKITLKDILLVAPRDRKRVDAYNTLVKFLKDEMGVELIINGRNKQTKKSNDMMKKKILFMGKVYDLATTTLDDIQNEIHDRILDYTSIDIPVSINILWPDQINITLTRNFGARFSNSSLMEQEMYLISGEGYKNYKPKYSLVPSIGIPYFPNITYNYGIDDYVNCYKKNIVSEGASKAKDIEIKPEHLTLSVTFKY